jgi:hypothetical protein
VVIIIIVVLSLAVVGTGVFFALKARGSTILPAKYRLNDKCAYNDPELCRYINNLPNLKNYTVNTVSTAKDGYKTESSFILDGDERFQSSTSADGKEIYNVITIGNTTYTKDYADGKWYKQTAEPAELEEQKSDFEIDSEDSTATETTKTSYQAMGKEKCGELNCFKYQVIVEGSTDTELIWFDDQDYLLRKSRSEDSEGNVTELTYNYAEVSVSEPSPVKDTPPQTQTIPGLENLFTPTPEPTPTEDTSTPDYQYEE